MKSIFAIVLSVFCLQLTAQNVGDAVRYSSLFPGGTARVLGAGGSFGAMGGDFGALTINPAGIADFRSSELTFSFSFNGGNTNSSIMGNSPFNTGHLDQPELENLGIVFSARPTGGSLVTNNLAIGLQQYTNYNQDFTFEGVTNGSITERFAELANARDPEFFDPFEAALAWETGAIFDVGEDLIYETDIDTFRDVYKRQDVSRSGKVNELAIAWAGKFQNNLSLGIGIGIPFISFEETKTYRESDTDDIIPFFDDLQFNERLATSGTGFNFKLGMGYTWERTIRFGFSYISPTYYRMDDNYDTAMTYQFTDSEGARSFTSNSPDGRFEYKLRTPSRVTASIGTIIRSDKVKGFLNFDVTRINYTANQFNFSDLSTDPGEVEFERELNQEIDNQLQSSYNFNLGGELAFDNFRVRGGIAMIGSPYFIDGSSEFNNIYTLGGGYRGDRFYIDVAYQLRSFSNGYIPYRVLDESRLQLVNNDVDQNKLAFTIGIKI